MWCVLLFLARVAAGSHWKVTRISIESRPRMSITNMDACDAAVIAVQRLWDT